MHIKRTIKEFKEVETIIENFDECDKCGAKIPFKYSDAFKCEIELTTGFRYPEGGSGEVRSVDLCASCAENLFSLLTENGYRINKSEWDD